MCLLRKGTITRRGGKPGLISLIGTSTNANALKHQWNARPIFAQGRYWVFYYDGTNFVYRTSINGLTWTDSISLGACNGDSNHDVWFEPNTNKIYYVRSNGGSTFYTRWGTLQTDGSILWDVDEFTITDAATVAGVSITKDSVGNLWVVYYRYQATTPEYLRIWKYDTSWTYITQIKTPIPAEYRNRPTYSGRILPLSEGKLAIVVENIWGTWGDKYLWVAKSADGVSWTWSTGIKVYGYPELNEQNFSAVASGDDVYIAFYDWLTYDVKFVKWNYTDGWGTVVTVKDGVSGVWRPGLTRSSSTGTLYCFYCQDSGNVFYLKRSTDNGATWKSEEKPFYTSFNNPKFPRCGYDVYNSRILVVWQEGTESPYNIKFAKMTI